MPTVFNPPRSLTFEMLALCAQLRWKHALVDCQVENRDYTEIHFWRNPETDELVLTYWEITP
jgi:hypothetical protein